jgi:hypothetical protein
MRPPIDDSVIAIICAEIPEFNDYYLDLLDIYDEDLTPEIVLMELADFVANLVVSGGREETLERCCAAVEHLAAGTARGPELVAACFLNELPHGSRAAIQPYLGRLTDRLAESVYGGDGLPDLEGPARGRPRGGTSGHGTS